VYGKIFLGTITKATEHRVQIFHEIFTLRTYFPRKKKFSYIFIRGKLTFQGKFRGFYHEKMVTNFSYNFHEIFRRNLAIFQKFFFRVTSNWKKKPLKKKTLCLEDFTESNFHQKHSLKRSLCA
jgi:hypothetical protein